MYITSHGIEIYSVLSEKRNVKALKHLNTTIAVSSLDYTNQGLNYFDLNTESIIDILSLPVF